MLQAGKYDNAKIKVEAVIREYKALQARIPLLFCSGKAACSRFQRV